MTKRVLMRLDKFLAEILASIDPTLRPLMKPDGTFVVVLNKALYGCIESALLWYKVLRVLEAIGFAANPYDPCVFIRVREGRTFTIGCYVDDLMLIGHWRRPSMASWASSPPPSPASLHRRTQLRRNDHGHDRAQGVQDHHGGLCDGAHGGVHRHQWHCGHSIYRNALRDLAHCGAAGREEVKVPVVAKLLYLGKRSRPDTDHSSLPVHPEC
jgi:hypothetical protein